LRQALRRPFLSCYFDDARSARFDPGHRVAGQLPASHDRQPVSDDHAWPGQQQSPCRDTRTSQL